MVFALLAGLAAGLVHVVSGPDHLAAVAPLAAAPGPSTRHRSLLAGLARWRIGVQWGLGHTAGVVLIGVLLLLVRTALPLEAISAYSERIVGVALLGVGVWGGWRAWQWHGRRGTHGHVGTGASFAMGALHGLAGSSHLFGILPALALPTHSAAVAYLSGFGAGAVLGMTAFAALVGIVAARADRRHHAHPGVLYACSLSAFLVGGLWLIA